MKAQHDKTLHSSQAHPDMLPSGRVSLGTGLSSPCHNRSQKPWAMSTRCKPVSPRLCGSKDRHTTAPFPFLSCSSKHVLFHTTSTVQVTMATVIPMMITTKRTHDLGVQGIRNLLFLPSSSQVGLSPMCTQGC